MSNEIMSRRKFLMYAGGAAGVTAMAGFGWTGLALPKSDAGSTVGSTGAKIRYFGASPELAARLQQTVDDLAGKKGHPHAVLAVESGDGAFRWAGAAGEAYPDGAAMTPAVPYFIASIDKLYVAAAVMRLAERGLVDIDDPIATYLPPQLTTRIHVSDGIDRSGEITVRNLLSHTSGLPDHLEDRPKDGPSLIERLVAEGDMDWSFEQTMDVVRDGLNPHFAPQPMDSSKPKVRYCDTNYQLLIALVETISDATLDRVLDEMIFRPAGMRHTWLEGLSEPAAASPAPATLWFDDRPLSLPRFLTAIRTIYSTTEDQIASFRALVDGRVFADPATFGLMQQWNDLPFPTDSVAARAPGWPLEYGFGIKRLQMPRLFTKMRLLPPAIGHSGSTGSWLFYCPDMDLYLAGTVDQGAAGAVPYRLVPKLLRILADGTERVVA